MIASPKSDWREWSGLACGNTLIIVIMEEAETGENIDKGHTTSETQLKFNKTNEYNGWLPAHLCPNLGFLL